MMRKGLDFAFSNFSKFRTSVFMTVFIFIMTFLISMLSMSITNDEINVSAQDTNTTTDTEVECGICGSTACTSSLIIYFGLGTIIGWYLGYVKAPKVGRSSPTWFFLGLLTNVLALVVWYVVKDQDKNNEREANFASIDNKNAESNAGQTNTDEPNTDKYTEEKK